MKSASGTFDTLPISRFFLALYANALTTLQEIFDFVGMQGGF